MEDRFPGENKNMKQGKQEHFIKIIYTHIFLCKNRLISTLDGRGVLGYLKLGQDCSEFFNFHPSLTDGTGEKAAIFLNFILKYTSTLYVIDKLNHYDIVIYISMPKFHI